MGFSNWKCQFNYSSLSTINQPGELMGQKAFELFIRITTIEKGDAVDRQIIELDTDLSCDSTNSSLRKRMLRVKPCIFCALLPILENRLKVSSVGSSSPVFEFQQLGLWCETASLWSGKTVPRANRLTHHQTSTVHFAFKWSDGVFNSMVA